MEKDKTKENNIFAIAEAIQQELIDQTMTIASLRNVIKWGNTNGYIITVEEARAIVEAIDFRP